MKMRKCKWLFGLMAAVTLAAGVVGCGSTTTGDDSAKVEGEDKSSDETATLRVTMALSEEEWAVMREKVISKFEAENNCKVEAVQVEAADVIKKLEAMNGAGKMEIDLLAQDVNNTYELIAKGLVEDLTEYESMIPEAAIGKLSEAGKVDGKMYFMPYRPNAEMNFYNSKYFDQYEVAVPTTWDELYDAAKTIKEKDGLARICFKLGMDGDPIEMVEFIRAAGGDPLVLNDEGCVEALTYLQKLWPELSENTLTAGFSSMNGHLAKEEVYYGPNWPFAMNIVVKDGGKTEILANPGVAGPKGLVKTLGGEVLGIPVGSPNKDLALKFIEYLQSAEVQATFMKDLGWASFRNDVYEEVEEWQKPYFEVLTQCLEVAEPLPNVPYWGKAQQALNDASREILMDGADVKTTLDKYAEQLQKEIENFK